MKGLVVRVYRIGFRALFIGRMKITTHELMVPVGRNEPELMDLKEFKFIFVKFLNTYTRL